MKNAKLGKVKDFFDNLKKNRVLFTAMAVVVAFRMLVVTSFAWLTLNRKTDVGDMGMGLAVDDTAVVYEAYMYDLKTNKGTNIGPDEKTLDITNIDLNQYDTIFKAQNKYTPVVARIKIVRNKSMPSAGKVYITINRDNKDAEGDSLTPYTSSIVRFTSFIMSDKSDLITADDGKSVPITEPDTLYSLINTKERYDTIETYKGNEYPNSKTFVTVDREGENHTHGKTTTLTIETKYTNSDWYINTEGHQTLNVYLYITYDVQLVECYMDEKAGGSLSLDDNSVFFDNDMKKVSVSYSA